MRFARHRAAIGAVLGLALLATACGGGSTSGDGTLVLYSGRDEGLVGPLIERFEQESGITVEARYGGSTEIAAQLLEEGSGTPAEVFLSQDAGALGALSAAGRLARLPAEVAGAVDPAFSAADKTWLGVTGRARVVVYDSQELSADQVPGDVTQLVEPQWRGRVAIAPTNASFQAFVTALRVTEGEDAARAWLQELKANDAQIMQNNVAILEAVNTGAVDVGLINHYYWAGSETDPAALRAQIKFGDPGTASALVNVSGVAILAEAADSPEARALVEFLVGTEAQTYFAEETAEYPLVAGVPGPQGVPTLDELDGPDIDLSDLASLEQTVAMLTEVGLV
jgi:iron(III) transport system substrate-binding protein